MTKSDLTETIPIPPLEMRQLIGLTDEKGFDNPNGTLVVPNIPIECYDSVFDFGCGCGRIARKLLQQEPRPKRYLGIDLHKGMLNWCRRNLAPYDSAFEFRHHDIYSACFNPNPKRPKFIDLPASDRAFSMVLAWSVFTHLTQSQAEHYLTEVSRILSTDGILVSTWFLFEKRYFPMMQDFQNALYINEHDPTNAVIYDREWLESMFARTGLEVVYVAPPTIRGFQWEMHIAHVSSARPRVTLPIDQAPFGRVPPPVLTRDPSRVGDK